MNRLAESMSAPRPPSTRSIDDLASQGLAVMLISSELPEVINLSTRILVMRDGRLAGELSRQQASQESVLRLMAGVPTANAA